MMTVSGSVMRILAASGLSVVLSILALVAVRSTGVDLKDFRNRNRPAVLAIAAFFNLLFILSVALLLRIWDQQPLSTLGFKTGKRDWLFAAFAMLVSVGLGMGWVTVLHRMKLLHLEPLKNRPFSNRSWYAELLALVVLFIAALQEEILFRGYFSFVLLPYGFFYAMVISAILFTVWHFLTNRAGMFQVLDWLIGGIMLFYIYFISGSVWVAALVHFSRNLTNVLVFNITGTSYLFSYEEPMKPSLKSAYTILYSILLMACGHFFFRTGLFAVF